MIAAIICDYTITVRYWLITGGPPFGGPPVVFWTYNLDDMYSLILATPFMMFSVEVA